ncbi:amidohydrolase family protein [Novosphingobium sp. FSY-8]|uniref:Amidohydrolase family protein n=1 Tax=Novosphingobium ovatum TaxID=1908523 RepID=A0ABW9XA01_9SPHN|nr:amidohydrolase family protein [Novosphingobium ovatum]NBC35359.1 amidohydrolase family protein [Novosphingobium ovatum]
MSAYDLIIRGGTIADGTGGELREADIAVQDGRIAAVGEIPAKGVEEIDARHMLVTPGFVDLHTHYDAQVTWDSHFSPSTNHGVTTVLLGNCGVGFAPCKPDMREEMINVMEGVEDIPGIVMAEGLPWNWTTFPDYLDALAQRHMDADFAVAVPHIPVRVWVMGQRAIDREPATTRDMARMAAIVAEGMAAGAFGFSTTRVIGHRTAGGQQLPVTTASEDELMHIALAMKPYGKALFMSASEFDTTHGFSGEFNLLQRVAQASGHTVTFPLLQYNEAPDRWHQIAEYARAARAGGADMLGQVVGRPVGVLMGLQLTLHPFRGCPSYDAIDALPLPQRVAAMRQPDTRAAILREYGPDGKGTRLDPAKYPAFMRFIHLCYPMGADPDYSPPESRRLDNLAAARGVTLPELAYDLLLEEEGQAILYFPARNFTAYNLDVVHQMLTRDDTVLGLGDGGAHCGAICDGSMQTYMLSYWTRDRVGDRLSIPQAVEMMTRHTARVMGLNDRGVIAPGMKADFNIIDYDRLALRSPRASFDLPAGGRRLTQDAVGYAATIVSGVATHRNDAPTGNLPGRLLRRAVPHNA